MSSNWLSSSIDFFSWYVSSFLHLFIHLFIQQTLLSTHYVSDTILDNKSPNKTDQTAFPFGACILVREVDR